MEVKILFDSQNNDEKKLANEAKNCLEKSNFKAEIINMRDAYLYELNNYKNMLLIVNTSFDGEPSESAEELYDELSLCDMSEVLEKVNLLNLNYAVFTIGQSNAENFCKAGVDFDKFLNKFGAKRLLMLERTDKSFKADFKIWLKKVEQKLKKIKE